MPTGCNKSESDGEISSKWRFYRRSSIFKKHKRALRAARTRQRGRKCSSYIGEDNLQLQRHCNIHDARRSKTPLTLFQTTDTFLACGSLELHDNCTGTFLLYYASWVSLLGIILRRSVCMEDYESTDGHFQTWIIHECSRLKINVYTSIATKNTKRLH